MKPALPQGTRDFSAAVVRKRNYILNTIKNVFELYGFQPLETPALENLSTLTGKYGEEGDKLLFKILNNGLDNPVKHQQALADFNKVLEGKNTSGITERALRYDLTIPFARYVAMNHGQLTFPFKRYQIQPVWRADRPQRGRYREFLQCDADVAGSDSLVNDAEFASIYIEVFKKLNLDVELKINSRKILSALVALCGEDISAADVITAIDKLDKIGIEKVKDELISKNIGRTQIEIIENYLTISGNNQVKLAQLKNVFASNKTGIKGIEEVEFVLSYLTNDLASKITIDPTLARGLDYYTGIIFEVKAKDVQMGSIGGGGRYDDLTGLFGVPDLPGAGISFGVDRIYDVLEEKKLFPLEINTSSKVLFFNLGEKESKNAFQLAQILRSNNIACELYAKQVKLDKQFKYAEKNNIQYVAIIGSNELENNSCVIKNLQTSQQQVIRQDEIINFPF